MTKARFIYLLVFACLFSYLLAVAVMYPGFGMSDGGGP